MIVTYNGFDMMYCDTIEEYPYEGVFYTKEVQGNFGEEEEITEEILVTRCDIQGGVKSNGVVISNGFSVYFPLYEDVPSSFQRGVFFRGNARGLEVNGVVESISPSQLNGCKVTLKDLDV